MKVPTTRIIVAAMLSGLIVAGAYAADGPRTVRLTSATQDDQATTAPTIGDEHQGQATALASSETDDQGTITPSASGAGSQNAPNAPTGDTSSPTDEPDPTPAPQPRKLISTVQRLDGTPGQPLRVDVYCTYTFDDGTSEERYVGNLPKPGLPGPQVQMTCPDWMGL